MTDYRKEYNNMVSEWYQDLDSIPTFDKHLESLLAKRDEQVEPLINDLVDFFHTYEGDDVYSEVKNRFNEHLTKGDNR